MKSTIFLTFCLWVSMTTVLFSQAPVSASCKYKHLTFYAEKSEGVEQIGGGYINVLVKDSLRQSIDTVGKFENFYTKKLCLCTDTSLLFYVTNVLGHPNTITHFNFNGHKWNNTFLFLPDGDLTFIGVLTPGKKYNSYRHKLITPEKVISITEIFEGDENSSLSLIGSYEFEFTYSTDKKNYVLTKETLKKK